MFSYRRSQYLPFLTLFIVVCTILFYTYNSSKQLTTASNGFQASPEAEKHESSSYTTQFSEGLAVERPLPQITTPTIVPDTPVPDSRPEPERLSHVPIIGLVFYGRRAKVELLNCHLQKALNKGYIDEVVWLPNTNDTDDLAYLDNLMKHSSRYKLLELGAGEGYMHGYDFLREWPSCHPDCIVLKVDDDIIWVADETIPQLTNAAIRHPEYLLISANLIVSPLMGMLHLSRGALHPYLPDQGRISSPSEASWDYHDYPSWTGPSDYSLKPKDEGVNPQSLWLPSQSLSRTPLKHIQYNEWGNGFMSWMLAHQQHLSLLQNLRDGRLDRYWARTGEFFFPTKHRLSINLFAMNSTYILNSLPMENDDDEYTFAIKEPKKQKKRVAIMNKALAAHYGFRFMQPEIDQTDALARYRNYTFTHVCPDGGP